MTVVMPFLLAVIYVALVTATLPRSEGELLSLAGVRALFDRTQRLIDRVQSVMDLDRCI